MFRGIRKLAPGTRLIAEGGEILILGFALAPLKGIRRQVPQPMVDFVRAEQMRRIRDALRPLVPLRW
jgi:hypothetical protein